MKVSFEFFPPRTDKGIENLTTTWRRLAALGPEYFSVTFGAGGSTLEGTFDTVKAIAQDTARPATPHISCIAATRAGVASLLNRYREIGLEKGFMEVPSGPMVRSSYRADRVFEKNNLGLAVPDVPASSNAQQIPVKAVD